MPVCPPRHHPVALRLALDASSCRAGTVILAAKLPLPVVQLDGRNLNIQAAGAGTRGACGGSSVDCRPLLYSPTIDGEECNRCRIK